MKVTTKIKNNDVAKTMKKKDWVDGQNWHRRAN